MSESVADKLGRGFRPLWGVVSNTDLYFNMIRLVARNRVFSRIFGYRRRDGKKPGFLIAREWPETSVSPIVRQGFKPLSHSKSPLKRTKDFLIFISAFQSVSTDFRY